MTSRHVHPAIFMFLILPFGAMSGYLTVAIAYQLAHAGVSVVKIAALIALSFVPHTWKFAWAPIADTSLSRKAWYLIAAVISAAGLWAMGALPATGAGLSALSTITLVANVAVTFLGMSVESLMAYGAHETEKGRAAGWFQAGNLGGNGLGGGLGLFMTQHLPAPWMSGAILGALCLSCAAGLLFVPEPAAAHREGGLGRSLANVAVDLWKVARAPLGILALVLCFLPLCTGAASGLWSAISGDWHASANSVALVTGVLGGIISAVGCLAGGWICDRMHRQWAYALFGAFQALTIVGMAFAPRTESSYVIFTSVYAFTNGLAYAGFSAFVLEAMGLGAAATKYNVFASLSNTPIMYMTQIDGWAHTRWHAEGMLLTEAAFAGIGIAMFAGLYAIMRRVRVASARAPDSTPSAA